MLTKRNVVLLIVTVFLSAQGFSAQSLPEDTIRLQPFLGGLSSPLYITNAKDGSNRLFVVQQRGIIKVVQPGATTTADFLNVSSVVSSTGSERGLLGLAFHPQYPTNRRFFIYYTRQSDGAIEIAEYETSVGDPNVANPTAVRVIITIPHPISNHNGGTILFGPDGFLYAGTGDGGGANDTSNNAQNINSLLGKFLRIDINTPVGQQPAYNIPPTNPYAGATPGLDEIYAIGMRNPYRFSFDRGGTNQLWVGDVGQGALEEVDIITLGGNYGWRVYEGTQCTGNDPSLCIPANYLPPVFEYSSGAGSARCSVTGGYVYRGTKRTFPDAAYVYADYCTGELLHWFNSAQVLRLDSPRNTSAIGEDEAGELYMVGLGGTVEKIVRQRTSADFDGDLRTDLSVFRPSNGTWYIANSSSGLVRTQGFGLTGDIPTAEDFDGDTISDIGVFRPSTGVWYYYRSSDNVVGISQFGSSGDVPTAGDYDGDAKADLSVFRPSTGTWYVFRSLSGTVSQRPFGVDGDIPTVGDYDGDGKYDVSVFRPSNGTWYWGNAFNNSFAQRPFGSSGDIPTQGDFDGDGRTDVAVFRPSNGVWYVVRSSTGAIQYTNWGVAGDVPAVGDYDEDGLDDVAVYRPSNGVWYRINSSNATTSFTQFGVTGDLAVPKYDAP